MFFTDRQDNKKMPAFIFRSIIKEAFNEPEKNNEREPIDIPITYEQARVCLNIKDDNNVHSFWRSFCLSGADLELSRVEEILKDAAETNKLFLSDALGFLNHDVFAWDSKCEKWTYLECEPDKVALLRASLSKKG